MVEQRIERFGRWDGSIGEDIFYGDQTARERILLWLIDDGVQSRGHRKRLLGPDYKLVGIACASHAVWHDVRDYLCGQIFREIGRDDWIRTSDLTHPKRARYQAAPRPAKLLVCLQKIFCQSKAPSPRPEGVGCWV